MMITKKFVISTPNLAEEFVKNYAKCNTVVLYGGGHAVYWYIKYLRKFGINPRMIVDKNISLKDDYCLDIPIISLEQFVEIKDKEKWEVVISAPKFREEIISELIQIVDARRIHSFEAEIYFNFLHDVNAYKDYLIINWEKLLGVYKALADDESRYTLTNVIKGRVSGNQKYFYNCYVGNQYWPENIIKFSESEVMVECGSNDGSTLKDLVDQVNGKFRRIYCFEPDKDCIKKMREVINNIPGDIFLIEKGAGAENSSSQFVSEALVGASHICSELEGDYGVDICRIDDFISDNVTYMKMDIEGSELSALQGSMNIIQNNKPKLAICVYHRNEDILDIYECLISINPDYKFYLRHHTWGATETVLYAV